MTMTAPEPTALAELIKAKIQALRFQPDHEEIVARMEQEERRKKQRQQLLAAGIPDANLNANGIEFDNQQRASLRMIWESIAGFSSHGKVWIVTGSRGAGKTTMVCRLLASWITKSKGHARYSKLSDLLELQVLYSGQGVAEKQQKHALQQRDRFANHNSLLAIDEVHENRSNANAAEILVDLVDRRYSAGRHTVLISNLEPENLEDCINPSILDRARDGGGIVSTMGWTNYRIEKAKGETAA